MSFTLDLSKLKANKDWRKEQLEREKRREAERAERKEFIETIIPEYEEICKQIGYCIYQYVGEKTFKPTLLMGDYDFIRMNNVGIVLDNYSKYLTFVRKQPYSKKQNANKKNHGYTIEYAPWSFKDRWNRIMNRLKDMNYLEVFTENVHGSNMTFHKFNKDKIKELEREAFIQFI